MADAAWCDGTILTVQLALLPLLYQMGKLGIPPAALEPEPATAAAGGGGGGSKKKKKKGGEQEQPADSEGGKQVVKQQKQAEPSPDEQELAKLEEMDAEADKFANELHAILKRELQEAGPEVRAGACVPVHAERNASGPGRTDVRLQQQQRPRRHREHWKHERH